MDILRAKNAKLERTVTELTATIESSNQLLATVMEERDGFSIQLAAMQREVEAARHLKHQMELQLAEVEEQHQQQQSIESHQSSEIERLHDLVEFMRAELQVFESATPPASPTAAVHIATAPLYQQLQDAQHDLELERRRVQTCEEQLQLLETQFEAERQELTTKTEMLRQLLAASEESHTEVRTACLPLFCRLRTISRTATVAPAPWAPSASSAQLFFSFLFVFQSLSLHPCYSPFRSGHDPHSWCLLFPRPQANGSVRWSQVQQSWWLPEPMHKLPLRKRCGRTWRAWNARSSRLEANANRPLTRPLTHSTSCRA